MKLPQQKFILWQVADQIAQELEAKGISVMLDDRRDASPGVKFKDAELIGNPYIVIVGKGLQEGKIEFRIRRSGDKSELPVGEVVSHLSKLLG
jgi:prolyl-tRNA synthetase